MTSGNIPGGSQRSMRVMGRRWGYMGGCTDWVGTRSLVCGLGVLPVPSSSGSGFGRHSFAK